MRAVLIANNVVTNTIIVGDDYSPPEGVELIANETAAIGDTYDPATGKFAPPPPPPRTLDDMRAEKVRTIDAVAEALLSTGAPQSGLHVALMDGARADMGAMATTAIGAITTGGAVPWPASYQLGWITIENIRIPLPTPQDGLNLAAAVGDFYARVKQRGRDLKDLALAAPDKAALDAIDETAGWPG